MTVLLDMHTCQIQLLVGLYLLREQGSFGSIRDGAYLVWLRCPGKNGALLAILLLVYCQLYPICFCSKTFAQHCLRAYCTTLIIKDFAAFIGENDVDILFAGTLYLELIFSFLGFFYAEDNVFAGILYHSHLTVRHEILHKLLLFVRHEPCEVRLVFCIDTRHQFDIRSVDTPLVLVRQRAVPGASEISVTPCPLLLAGREMVGGYMQHTSLGVIFIATFEVVFRVDSHI